MLMDVCHQKLGVGADVPKYKRTCCAPSDIVKDDSGSYAVITEQGSSASQVMDAIVMDGTARLPGCAGQAADAVSAYSQVKMHDAPSLLKLPRPGCPDIWIRLPRDNWLKSWSINKESVVLLEQNVSGHPLE